MALVKIGGLLSLMMEVRSFSESKGAGLVTDLRKVQRPLEKHTDKGKQQMRISRTEL